MTGIRRVIRARPHSAELLDLLEREVATERVRRVALALKTEQEGAAAAPAPLPPEVTHA